MAKTCVNLKWARQVQSTVRVDSIEANKFWTEFLHLLEATVDFCKCWPNMVSFRDLHDKRGGIALNSLKSVDSHSREWQ